MSRSYYSYPREKSVKFFGKRVGWYGEQCWSQHGRKFIKRLMRRMNRRWLNKLENLYANTTIPANTSRSIPTR